MMKIKKFEELTLEELYHILKLREEVFILEQHILAEAEIDGHDFESIHYFWVDNEKIVAYMRTYYVNDWLKLGRICTKADFRHLGIATKMIKYILERNPVVFVSAQYQSRKFYEKLGFKPMSKKYKEAGIDHIKMIYVRN